MYDFKNMFPKCDVTKDGIVFRDGKQLHAFHSNNYLQVILFDKNNKKHTLGVHTVVAMKYLDDYYEGCVVHHIDGNRSNNCVENLKVFSKSEHTRLHNKGNMTLALHNKKYGPANKGKKMSAEFCKKCSESAKKRKGRKFNGNQYVDKFGNKIGV